VLTAEAANTDGATIAVCAELENVKAAAAGGGGAGALASEEVVQVYAMPGADVAAAAAQPPRALLLGFVRTDVLDVSDTATICLTIHLADLRLAAATSDGVDTGASDFKVLPGKYTLTVGGRGPGAAGVHIGTSQQQGAGAGVGSAVLAEDNSNNNNSNSSSAASTATGGIPSAPLEMSFEVEP